MDRSRSQCFEKVGLKKGPWIPEEDQKLMAFIEEHDHGTWHSLPGKAGLRRCGKSFKLRWINYLRPDIKRGKFSLEEEHTIVRLQAFLGNKWSTIAAHLPQRTDYEIKNYWHNHLKKRLTKVGIDPITHRPKTNGFGYSKDVSNLSHMAQWESARLEAEARLVQDSRLENQLSSSFSKPARFILNKISLPQPSVPPPCLDVLTAWQRSWTSSSQSNKDHTTVHDMYATMLTADGLESPAFPESMPLSISTTVETLNNNKDVSNLSHMAQWESARLEAEARLVQDPRLENQLDSSFPQPSVPPPCPDVLTAWQRSWTSSSQSNKDHTTVHDMYGMMLTADGLESPAFPESMPLPISTTVETLNNNFLPSTTTASCEGNGNCVNLIETSGDNESWKYLPKEVYDGALDLQDDNIMVAVEAFMRASAGYKCHL
ncbi:hypothetical protein L6164_027065 [Bauhinia variegata]|uniref:Uncharacterized protein n=1 Tax=Bauhinia variegata TaxID=167791 RepID=A0ACB9LSF7_BAUVA|nr:hypothetical protein L6164_027065 [Bauhinia variegata]